VFGRGGRRERSGDVLGMFVRHAGSLGLVQSAVNVHRTGTALRPTAVVLYVCFGTALRAGGAPPLYPAFARPCPFVWLNAWRGSAPPNLPGPIRPQLPGSRGPKGSASGGRCRHLPTAAARLLSEARFLPFL
jgi:hypothetical protein